MKRHLGLLESSRRLRYQWVPWMPTLFVVLCSMIGIATSFTTVSPISSRVCIDVDSALYMVKATKKKKTKKTGGGGSSSGLKGFGSVGGSSSVSSSSSSSKRKVELDRSKQAMAFYDFMEAHNAGDNLSRCALGYFPLSNTTNAKLRGVTALKPIKNGDTIIRIPYEMAVNLGKEGADPTIPALELLRDYCETLSERSGSSSSSSNSGSNENNVEKAAYYRMLPEFRGEDCMGSTDFFSDNALEALQSPLIVEETLKRREKVNNRFQLDLATAQDIPSWVDGSPISVEHLLWAVWLVTSRVLTVQGSAEEGNSYRLLIPFLDMCNHDRSSAHILTGRAEPGGELKVVAGSAVKDGDAINICYGGGMAGNDRFIQDYGFLDAGSDDKAFDIVAQQLLGKRRIVEGVGAGRFISEKDRLSTMDSLGETAIEQDVRQLEEEIDPSVRAAIAYRIGVKKALARYDI